MREADMLEKALGLPRGARFYKCALQVNPFGYLKRYRKPLAWPSEEAYNAAVIAGCREAGIEVIAITDHYQVRSSEALRRAAVEAGLQVFPGFEAVTKEGVHLLCLFGPARQEDELERIIGDCGIHDTRADSPVGQHDVLEFLSEARKKWGAVCIAAHVCTEGGLLQVLKGQPRINAWKSSDLLACALTGPLSEAPDNLRSILENKQAEYRRLRAVAVINAQDVFGPGDLVKPGASCWIKMTEVSIEGLRQAFLDPESRVRLNSDPVPEEHSELEAICWEGGFLDGQGIHFNENLNALIGGRGTGKSTIVESIRYALGLSPLGEEARRAHEGILRQVLRSGTKISMLVTCHRPAEQQYRIERTVPSPPVVRDHNGQVLKLTPQDVLPQMEVYGQHEISELARSPEKLTLLLQRFVKRDPVQARRKTDLRRELERSRGGLTEGTREIQHVEERLASLPSLEETLRRFQDAGLEERLKEQSLLVREERILASIPERVSAVRELAERLAAELPIDLAFVSPKALAELPGKEILAGIADILERLNRELLAAAKQIQEVLARADQDVAQVRERWLERKRAVEAAYEKILRELQKSRVDGEEFIRLRRQIEELRPLRERLVALQKNLAEQQHLRRNLLAEWEDVKAAEFRQLQRAAKGVTKRLDGRVDVEVSFAGDREPLFSLLRERIGGRLSEALEALRARDSVSLKEVTETMREGALALQAKYGIPGTQAERLAKAPLEATMEMEELDLPHTTVIRLNVAAEGQPPVWQALADLSTGQKATAVLLLLLLESDAPLVVDQPEDDLDNRFVTEGVVPRMKVEKRRRQFLFTTHNANIPVLGDAELILALKASGEGGQGRAEIPIEHMGSIDTATVRDLVEEVLEGGREAFETRRLKYGF